MTEIQTQRRAEIMQACEKLFETRSFADINLKEISKVTSMSRPTIYNYFETKEEIFLALLTREYLAWTESLKEITDENSSFTKEAFAERIAESIASRPLMLRIISLNLEDLETRTRFPYTVEFKRSYGSTLSAMEKALQKFFPEKTSDEQNRILYAFFPFLYGVYAYTQVTEVQREAMTQAGISYRYQSEKELLEGCLKQLLQ